MLYTGADLHKDNCYLTTMNETGSLIAQRRVPNNEHDILEYFQKLEDRHRVVVESTAGWYWFNDLLEAQGIEVVLAHAKYLKAISYAKVKTDKIDSTTLATLLRMNLVAPAHKISSSLRGFRDTLRIRLRFVARRTSAYNSIHRIAEKFNCDNEVIKSDGVIPERLPEQYKLQMRCLYGQIELLNQHIVELEQSLHPHLIPDEEVQWMLWIPGIGKITAMTVYLEIDTIERFPDDRHFISYCRLVPGAKNSNRTERHRSGSKDGNRYLKIAFTDAAVHAVRYYPEIRAFYTKIRRRSNTAIAHTVVAKELARITYFVLKNKTPFKGFKGQKLERHKALAWPRLASPDILLARHTKP